MKIKMKLLFIGMYPNKVSPYRNVFFQNLIFAMADIGVDCTVISPVPITKYRKRVASIPYKTFDTTSSGSKIRVFYPRYISVSSVQIGKYNTETLSELFFEKSVMKTVKSLNEQFDAVYGHFVLYGGLAAIKVGNYLNIPSYFAYGECDFKTEVGNTYGIPSPDQIKGLRGVVSVSSKNTNELNELGFVKGIPILTAPNSTDLSLFTAKNKEKCREKLGIPKDKFVVGFVGGFIERKGDKRLLAAVNELNDVYAAFAGRGDSKPIGEKVVFCQALEHDQVPILLNAVDVFCLPTLAEGSCNAIVEAMACGLPVISSNLPFNDDVLDESNSIRIDPMSIDQIKNAIEQLKEDGKRKELSTGAYKTAQNLSISARAERILHFIENTM